MKSLYLGMAIIALVLIALSISIETSVGKNIRLLNKNNRRNTSNDSYNDETEMTTAVTYSLGLNSLHNTSPPERSYGPNNLNHIFLRKYYNKNYPNNVQISNKFYVPN